MDRLRGTRHGRAVPGLSVDADTAVIRLRNRTKAGHRATVTQRPPSQIPAYTHSPSTQRPPFFAFSTPRPRLRRVPSPAAATVFSFRRDRAREPGPPPASRLLGLFRPSARWVRRLQAGTPGGAVLSDRRSSGICCDVCSPVHAVEAGCGSLPASYTCPACPQRRVEPPPCIDITDPGCFGPVFFANRGFFRVPASSSRFSPAPARFSGCSGFFGPAGVGAGRPGAQRPAEVKTRRGAILRMARSEVIGLG